MQLPDPLRATVQRTDTQVVLGRSGALGGNLDPGLTAKAWLSPQGRVLVGLAREASVGASVQVSVELLVAVQG